tara:strand:+ start:1394 stop:3289 length:1896 start_codon:yes stop_codon:yes gene_type:complete
MCGIVGIYTTKKNKVSIDDLKKLTKKLNLRGPDNSDFKLISENLIFGHFRLSIIDTSSAGSQPMMSFNDNSIITYNGEIYNSLELYNNIHSNSNINFKGKSDTEVLINYLEIYGIDKTLNHINGMYAFAYYNIKENKLYFARDIFGQKPLYYYFDNEKIIFASTFEIVEKIINFLNPQYHLKIQKEILENFTKYSYIHSPNTIDPNIKKLEASQIIDIDLNNFKVKKQKYYNLETLFLAKKINTSYLQSKYVLKNKINDAVKRHLISDVNTGVLLSGGIDSSLIASSIKEVSNKKFTSFTIGFDNIKYDEAKYSKKISNYLGFHHQEFNLDTSEMLKKIPEVINAYTEPFADSSQLPSLLLFEKIKKNSDIKVVLTGDGADELFCGYNRHQASSFIFKYFKNINPQLSKIALGVITFILDLKYHNSLSNYDKNKLSIAFLSKSFSEFYQLCIDQNSNSKKFFKDKTFKSLSMNFNSQIQNYTERMMYFDILDYLQNDLLVKVDMSSMYYGIESRAPFLDRELFEHAVKLPLNYKQGVFTNKKILRDILSDYLPTQLFDRPKKGFSLPLSDWLRNDLKKWSEDQLLTSKFESGYLIDKENLKEYWQDFLNNKNNNYKFFWNLIVFFNWVKNT